jgi:hypothetical protein
MIKDKKNMIKDQNKKIKYIKNKIKKRFWCIKDKK